MAIQFENTDKYGHVDASAYAMLGSLVYSKIEDRGTFSIPIYKDQAARNNDIESGIPPARAYVMDLTDSALQTALDAFIAALYAHAKAQDAELAAGTDV